MDLQLNGRVAVVTGASRGIGRAIAQMLSAEGALVVGGSRSGPVAVDLADPDGPAALIDHAIAAHGRIDVLVNNMGASRPRLGGFLEHSDEDWAWTLEVNLLATVRACRAALPHLLESGGTVVNVSSANASMPAPPVVAYSAAKAAITNLTKALDLEFGPRGVRVNVVSPGPVASDMWTGSGGLATLIAEATDTDVETVMADMPEQIGGLTTGRFATPEEIAVVVALLASPLGAAAAGTDLRIDSGLASAI